MTSDPSSATAPMQSTSHRLVRFDYLLPIGALLAFLLDMFASRWWRVVVDLEVAIAYVITIGFSVAVIIRASTAAAPTPWTTSRRLAQLGYLLPIGGLLAVLAEMFELPLSWPRHPSLERATDGVGFVLVLLVPIAAVIGIAFSVAAIIRARREAREGAGSPTRATLFAGIEVALGSLVVAIVVGLGSVVIAFWLFMVIAFSHFGF